jgi:4-amino-4-deoxy-L-arabinose transferase-like glycosyltransferase
MHAAVAPRTKTDEFSGFSERELSQLHGTENSLPPWPSILLGLASLNCAFQIIWFWRYTAHNINADAISYIGIARHVADGDFHASLHGYWSPLISWWIAGVSFFTHDFLLAARIVTIASFLLCLPLLYHLTVRLWTSPTLAALSVLCFTFCRSVVASSVYFIGADFLFTAAVLAYFILLLCCLEHSRPVHWLVLGVAHAVAFLAKAFAMPLLAIVTLLAAVTSGKRNVKHSAVSVIAAMAIPILVWGIWGAVLRTKYGRFTAGYQAKYNLLDDETKKSATKGTLKILISTSDSLDRYGVGDIMHPGSPLWNARLNWRTAVSQAFHKELKNLPAAFKELIILITPGGLIAFLLNLKYLCGPRFALAWIVAASSVLLIVGYCMLVFDGRYVLPLVPLLIAFAVPFLSPGRKAQGNRTLRVAASCLFAGSVVFLALYHASPFESLRRDFQTSVYSTASALHQLPSCDRFVTIGTGPFPAHGVGWEAGIYASYFAHCHMVGFSEEIPSPTQTQSFLADLETLHPDAILLLGNPQDGNYQSLFTTIHQQGMYPNYTKLSDPEAGEIGRLMSKL